LLVAESPLADHPFFDPKGLQWGRDLLVAESSPSQLLS
jgi:hypothetical protein